MGQVGSDLCWLKNHLWNGWWWETWFESNICKVYGVNWWIIRFGKIQHLTSYNSTIISPGFLYFFFWFRFIDLWHKEKNSLHVGFFWGVVGGELAVDDMNDFNFQCNHVIELVVMSSFYHELVEYLIFVSYALQHDLFENILLWRWTYCEHEWMNCAYNKISDCIFISIYDIWSVEAIGVGYF